MMPKVDETAAFAIFADTAETPGAPSLMPIAKLLSQPPCAFMVSKVEETAVFAISADAVETSGIPSSIPIAKPSSQSPPMLLESLEGE